MATIVLSSVGSLFGPVGKAIGTLAGSAIDEALFVPNDIEGARLRELTVSSSSYGNPISRLYGTMRVPGTIIWSTDLVEHRDRQGNGKGQPKTVVFSYTVSFAVALSSGPIDRVGKIWADGNLLRGANEDLKTAGQVRIYKGRADQPRDPAMEAALGDECPAFRGCSYIVFEDLDLSEFGNRIPSLSFEVFAGSGQNLLKDLLLPRRVETGETTRFPELVGFNHESGSIRDVARLVETLHPIAPQYRQGELYLSAPQTGQPAGVLAEPAAWDQGDFGVEGGLAANRGSIAAKTFAALRYYDPARDYQPGLQTAGGATGSARTFQFPGALSAASASALAKRANRRNSAQADTLQWRCAQLDPSIQPGSIVRASGRQGLWQVAAWEWRAGGIELELIRHRSATNPELKTDSGQSWSPPDLVGTQTLLRVFETPWDGLGPADTRRIYAATGSGNGRWTGAALFARRDDALIPLGQYTAERSATGLLVSALGPSSALRFEGDAGFMVDLRNDSVVLQNSDLAGIARGDNRLLVGAEVLQFLTAEPLGNGKWQVRGLLRGRGGTEHEAARGHESGTLVTLLDETLAQLGDNPLAVGTTDFAAIGTWDDEPALAALENAGAHFAPPPPVHTRISTNSEGSVILSWVRRARGQWLWSESTELPLVEETEAYEVGYGPALSPLAIWTTPVASLVLARAEIAELVALYGEQELWVRQRGSFAQSRPSLIGTLHL